MSQSLPCLFSQSSPCMMSKLLSCLFSQSCPLYDVQAPTLFVLSVFPSVRSPSLHPGTSNRCPRDLERMTCRRHCRTAEEQGKLSWPNMLIPRDTSPIVPCLTLQSQWRHGIQDFLGAGVVARLSSRQTYREWVALVGSGSSQPFSAFNQTISVLFHNKKGSGTVSYT